MAWIFALRTTSWVYLQRLALACTLISAAGGQVRAEDTLLSFLGAPGENATPIAFSVQPASELLIPFTAGTQANLGKPLEIYLTHFSGDKGDPVIMTPGIVELPDLQPQDQRLSFSLDKRVMTLRLKIPELPAPGKYTGNLIVLQEGLPPQTQAIELTWAQQARSAQLLVDQKSIDVYYTKSPLSWLPWTTGPSWLEEPASFAMLVRNAEERWPAEDVYLRLLEVTPPKNTGFDVKTGLTLTWNGQPAGDLWRSAAAADRSAPRRAIPPNGQVEIGGRFVDLPPGEYTIKVGLAAANAAPDDEEEVTLKVHVRHSVLWAGGVLLFAIALSFFANKGLETQRKRVALLKKIAAARPPWLREEPPTLPVVAARAMLKQAEERNRNWYSALFAPDILDARVTKASEIVAPLARVRKLRKDIAGWHQDPMIRNRAEKLLRLIVSELGPESADEKVAQQIQQRLDELRKWFMPEHLYDKYWGDLKRDIESLRGQVKPENFTVSWQRDVIDKLYQDIEKEPQNKSVKQAGEIEASYAKLKVLWDRQQDGDPESTKALNKLFELFKGGTEPSVDKFFQVVDDIAWDRIKAASKQEGGFEFVSPQRSTLHPLRAFQLIQFEVAPANRDIGKSYLFKHGLEYRWSLDLAPGTSKKAERPRQELTKPRTREPRVMQYVPCEGDLYVSVTLHRNGDTSDTIEIGKPFPIGPSADFGATSAFKFVEIAALGIATIFAVVSGLATFYFDAPVFGSAEDYIALFLWGAGVDQAKNFIQHLERTSASE